MLLFIIAGLIIEKIQFANHEAIGEICVWAGVLTTVIPFLIWLVFAGFVGKSVSRNRRGF